MPTEVVKTVKVDGTGNYPTLTLWESGEQRDLVSLDEIDVAECYSGTSSESLFVGGSTTDATRYREIRAAPGNGHGGSFSAGFRVGSSSTTAGAIKPFDDHLRINGIVIRAGSQTSGAMVSMGGGTSVSELWVGNCLIDGEGAGPSNGIVRTTGAGSDRYWNNIIRGLAGDCINCNQSGSTFVVYNNTLIGGTRGVWRVAGTVHLKNNIAQGQSTACYAGTFASSATNISSDATSPETGLRSIDLDFVNEAGKDYHLAETDTEAIGAGTDLHADGNLAFATDIDGDTRPNGAWDIGADQTAAGALLAQTKYRFYRNDGSFL